MAFHSDMKTIYVSLVIDVEQEMLHSANWHGQPRELPSCYRPGFTLLGKIPFTATYTVIYILPCHQLMFMRYQRPRISGVTTAYLEQPRQPHSFQKTWVVNATSSVPSLWPGVRRILHPHPERVQVPYKLTCLNSVGVLCWIIALGFWRALVVCTVELFTRRILVRQWVAITVQYILPMEHHIHLFLPLTHSSAMLRHLTLADPRHQWPTLPPPAASPGGHLWLISTSHTLSLFGKPAHTNTPSKPSVTLSFGPQPKFMVYYSHITMIVS